MGNKQNKPPSKRYTIALPLSIIPAFYSVRMLTSHLLPAHRANNKVILPARLVPIVLSKWRAFESIGLGSIPTSLSMRATALLPCVIQHRRPRLQR